MSEIPYMTESQKLTAEIPRVLQYLEGNGLDLGAGLHLVRPTSLGIDFGANNLNWVGNVKKLHWFKDNVLDYVFSSHVLEHVDNDKITLREWIRVLKPRGYLVLYVPDDAYFDNGPQLKNGEHKRVYTVDSVKMLAEAVGLSVCECFSHHGRVMRYPNQKVYSILMVGRKN